MVGAHALEDLEVVVRESAAVEVLEHEAAAVLAEPPPLLGGGGGEALGRRRQLLVVGGSKAMPQSASSSIALASPSKPEQDGPLHGGVLEELARQDRGEELVLAEVHEAGVAARRGRPAARRAPPCR